MSYGFRTKLLLRRMGVDVRRWSPQRECQTDAFAAQRWLMRGTAVKTIFDVGANVGQTAQKYLGIFPAAEVLSFEPFEEAFAKLERLFKDNHRVKPQRLAVSNVTGARRLFVNEQDVTNSLLPAATSVPGARQPIRMTGSVEVRTTTLDDFCAATGVSVVDILKLDIQGGELMALQGARDLLARRAIGLIYTEVLFEDMYENQARLPELDLLLREHGYTLYGLYDLNFTNDNRLAWSDAIFVHPELLKKGTRAAE